jgi:hypothetical protein
MRIRYVAVALAWAVSLALASWTRAQPPSWTPIAEPVIKAGDELGFRVEWLNGRTPYGQLVIRQNGEWIEARIGAPGDRMVLPPLPPAPPPPVQPR